MRGRAGGPSLHPSQHAVRVPQAILCWSPFPSCMAGWLHGVPPSAAGKSSGALLLYIAAAPILREQGCTIETIEAVGRSCGKVRLGEPEN